jgi:hypothetical protein
MMGRKSSGEAHRVLHSVQVIFVTAFTAVSLGGVAYAAPPDVNDGDSPGWQSHPAISPEVLAIMRKQEALNPAASIIMRAAILDGGGYSNLAFRGKGLTLYWKGQLPPAVAAAVATARRMGLVEVQPAAYSLAELRAEAEKLLGPDGLGGSDIQQIAYESDGSGLLVEKMPKRTAAAAAAKSAQPVANAEQKIAAANMRVPVTISTASRPLLFQGCLPCSRLDDSSPWNSGSFTRWKSQYAHPGKDVGCTTGFGVNLQGQSWVLTAAHCATRYSGWGDNAYDGAGELIGRATATEDWAHDIMIVNGRGYGRMWDGLPNTRTYKVVRSWGYWIDGEFLCQSGATSGTVCSLQTQRQTVANHGCDSDGDCYTVYDLGRVLHTQGQTASQGGDSGGPVFALDGSGVRAKGLLSAGDGSEMLFVTMNTITTGRGGNSPWPSGVVPRTA